MNKERVFGCLTAPIMIPVWLYVNWAEKRAARTRKEQE